MGNSEGNIVLLEEKAPDMYGQVMSWPDGVLASAFELCTFIPWEEAKALGVSLKEDKANPRDLKMRLAFEITKINHGEKAATEAQDYFIRTVQNKEMPTDIELKSLAAGQYKVIDLVVALGLSASRSEARRLIEQGGVKIGFGQDLVAIDDSQAEVEVKSDLIVQRGKRQFIKITTV